MNDSRSTILIRITLHVVFTSFVFMGLSGLIPSSLRAQERAESSSSREEMVSVPDQAMDARPWAIGVPLESQQRAIAFYEEGNKYLEASLFLLAVDKYREAIKSWNHPGIHYNLTLALINLDRIVEAYESLLQALRYGPSALEPEEYNQALNYKRLIGRQVAQITLICHQQDVKVTMDGKPLLTGPDRRQFFVLAGEHELLARKPGYLTVTRSLVLAPGTPVTIELRLLTLDEIMVTRRYWQPWKPWAVIGAGALLGTLGGVSHWRASVNFRGYESDLRRQCPDGCYDDEPTSPIARKRLAIWQQRLGIGSYAVAGATIGAGLLLVYLNRPRTYRREGIDAVMSGDAMNAQSMSISVVPSVTSGLLGITIGTPF